MRGEAVKSPSFNTGVPDVADPRLPEPLVAVDGSLVYQPFIMMVYEVSETDVSFHLELRPRDTSSRPQYLIVARHIYPPTLEVQNDGRGEVFWAVVPPNTSIYDSKHLSGDDVERAFTFFLSNTQFLRGKEAAAKISKHQRLTSRQLNYFYVGYRQLADLELNIYTVENPPPRPYPFQDQINVTLELRSFLSSCAFLQSGSISWETYGCNVSRETTVSAVVCECNHFSTFGATLKPLFTVPQAHSTTRGLHAETSELLSVTGFIFFTFLCAYISYHVLLGINPNKKVRWLAY
uniref:Uncharacterized protein n=1 Tax=Schistocephalus solidus TaxID=70667 RepID=A0A0X3PRK4_SCHSO